MVPSILGDSRLGVLQTALDGLAGRQQAIAGNIANIDTPGYQRKDVDFESSLRASIGAGQRLATTDPRHMQIAPAGGSLLASAAGGNGGQSTTGRNDDNNVDIDYEMTQLADTQLRYELMTQATAATFGTLNSIATKLT
ncbi:MAG TPA: flagellar basal body rod protein FlgB [Dehalococcoidia bacterium]|nr:flagellar basal body rod protein FlgB [Dehalococcoidia bacterium]